MLRRACEPHPVDLPSGGTLGGFHPWATVNAGGDGAAWQQPREEGQKTQQDSRCAAASAEGVVVLGTLETHLPGKPAVRSRRSRRRNGNSKDHTKTGKWIFTAAVFAVAKTCEQPMSPSPDEQLRRRGAAYDRVLSSRRGTLSCSTLPPGEPGRRQPRGRARHRGPRAVRVRSCVSREQAKPPARTSDQWSLEPGLRAGGPREPSRLKTSQWPCAFVRTH
ncbi:uncharacterized protein LOC119513410 isoform X1 [Choloepus didactylus]|uniref:uncharacterized protein LOC119513410 isoform X1 n=1 Tax=Choloepus didactylus TaxID=27675 RepID=UPI0018A11198|nr:uncharacterized protein LOC119513410 isoform X1 [Choloepus didactylus]